MIVFTDRVIAEIGTHIASYEPERGGALMGLPNSNVVCRFLPDPYAATTSITYQPSLELNDIVQREELSHGLQFFGIVHSHPGNFAEPSSGDHRAFLSGLNANPHMPGFVAPIVTLDRSANQGNLNELPMTPRGRMTAYVAYRPRSRRDSPRFIRNFSSSLRSTRLGERMGSDPGLTVLPVGCTVMHIAKHVGSVVRGLMDLGFPTEQESGFLTVSGCVFQSETLRAREFEAIFLFPPTYPVSRPCLLFTKTSGGSSGGTQELEFNWPFGGSENAILWDRCGQFLIAAIGGRGVIPPKAPVALETITAKATDGDLRGEYNDKREQSNFFGSVERPNKEESAERADQPIGSKSENLR